MEKKIVKLTKEEFNKFKKEYLDKFQKAYYNDKIDLETYASLLEFIKLMEWLREKENKK